MNVVIKKWKNYRAYNKFKSLWNEYKKVAHLKYINNKFKIIK